MVEGVVVNGPVIVPGVCGNLCVAAAACLGLQYTLDNSFVSAPLMVRDTSACSEIAGVSASRVLYDDNGREVAHEFEGDDTVVNCLLRRQVIEKLRARDSVRSRYDCRPTQS